MNNNIIKINDEYYNLRYIKSVSFSEYTETSIGASILNKFSNSKGSIQHKIKYDKCILTIANTEAIAGDMKRFCRDVKVVVTSRQSDKDNRVAKLRIFFDNICDTID